MKWIKYKIVCNENENILLDKKVGYTEKNLIIAQNEAYNGEYEIVEDSKIPVAMHGNYIGCMGYYWKAIDVTSRKIYLCREQTTPKIVTGSPSDYADSTFPTPAYEKDDLIAIVNSNKYYSPTAKIVSITNNVIEYEGSIGFTKINVVTKLDIDDYSMFVKERPEVGLVSIKREAFASGILVKAIGNGSFSTGGDNLSYGDWSFTTGTENKAAWAAFTHGYKNEGHGFYSETGGRENINNAECGRLHGYKNESTTKAKYADGSGQENYIDSQLVHVCGLKNKVYTKVLADGSSKDSRGSDVSGELNELHGARNVRMHGKGNKVYGADASNGWGGAQSEVGGLNNVLDGTKGTGTEAATNIHMHGEGNYVSHRNVDMGGKYNNSSAHNQMVRGTYNADDPNALVIVGCGTSQSDRRNAFTVHKDGGISTGTFFEAYYTDSSLTHDKIINTVNLGNSVQFVHKRYYTDSAHYTEGTKFEINQFGIFGYTAFVDAGLDPYAEIEKYDKRFSINAYGDAEFKSVKGSVQITNKGDYFYNEDTAKLEEYGFYYFEYNNRSSNYMVYKNQAWPFGLIRWDGNVVRRMIPCGITVPEDKDMGGLCHWELIIEADGTFAVYFVSNDGTHTLEPYNKDITFYKL